MFNPTTGQYEEWYPDNSTGTGSGIGNNNNNGNNTQGGFATLPYIDYAKHVSKTLGVAPTLPNAQADIYEWVMDPNNIGSVKDIFSFIVSNDYSQEVKDICYDVLNILTTNPNLSFDEVIDAIIILNSYTQTDYPGMDLNYEFEWWLDDDFIEENFNFGFDVGGGFDNLTAEEKVLVALFPAQALIIRENKEPAETETIIRFGNNGRNDKSDAFRHAFFNAMNSNDVGDIVARKFSNAHESETPPNLVLEKQMDLHNNNIGHNIGNNASAFISDQELSNLVYQSLIWGSLRYLSPLAAVIPPNFGITSSTQLIPTNQ